jgi:triacylglycerol lipase
MSAGKDLPVNSRHLVDPELLPVLEQFPDSELSRESLPALREQLRAMLPPAQTDAAIEVKTVAGPAGGPDIQLRVLRPKDAAAAPLPVIYHIHGGGFVAGTADQGDMSNGPLAIELNCAIVSVDYRLAPETVFPGSIEDCYAGLAWVFANAAEQGFDTARIGVMGESAGGGLAAALALLARDRGEYVWTPEKNRFGWEALLGHAPGGADVSPYAAPARATDLSGLPPTFLYAGALDLFLEENLDYARRLARAGVPIEFHLFPGAFHAFELQADAYVSRQARQLSQSALRRFLAPRT